jgi:hypothetical protein
VAEADVRKTRSIRLRWVLSRVAVAAIAGLVFAPPVAGQATKPRPPDVHYVPTPQSVVDAMLDMAQVTKNDVVYDLGCGTVASSSRRRCAERAGSESTSTGN